VGGLFWSITIGASFERMVRGQAGGCGTVSPHTGEGTTVRCLRSAECT
jgi:hypothetical protein